MDEEKIYVISAFCSYFITLIYTLNILFTYSDFKLKEMALNNNLSVSPLLIPGIELSFFFFVSILFMMIFVICFLLSFIKLKKEGGFLILILIPMFILNYIYNNLESFKNLEINLYFIFLAYTYFRIFIPILNNNYTKIKDFLLEKAGIIIIFLIFSIFSIIILSIIINLLNIKVDFKYFAIFWPIISMIYYALRFYKIDISKKIINFSNKGLIMRFYNQ